MIPILLVVNTPDHWPIDAEGVEVVGARQYLIDPRFSEMRGARVFNACRSYSYQSLGYYVSLLAEARGHRPSPDVTAIQDMKSVSLVRVITDDLDRLIQKTLRTVHGNEFALSIYFGKTLAKRDRTLGSRLFGLFRSPMLRAQFVRRKKWVLQNIGAISTADIPDNHRDDLRNFANDYFRRRQWTTGHDKLPRYYLAILRDPHETQPPSNQAAIEKFIRAAQRRQMAVTEITRDDYGRIGEYDALFIRTTTSMDDYTYRFARRAAAEGLAVIDDPVSIARCTNKVYLAEALSLAKIPTPTTVIVHRDNVDQVLEDVGLPCVLKQPDSQFSAGVTKAQTAEEYHEKIEKLLDDSEMVIAQQFLPTEFDWRVGVLDGQPLYVCRYYMARHHWQIIKHEGNGKYDEGNADTLTIEQAPAKVIKTAVKAANLMGKGLYGVDLKQYDKDVYVIEVNDNPSLDSGCEDLVLKDVLYDRIIDSLINRIEQLRQPPA